MIKVLSRPASTTLPSQTVNMKDTVTNSLCVGRCLVTAAIVRLVNSAGLDSTNSQNDAHREGTSCGCGLSTPTVLLLMSSNMAVDTVKPRSDISKTIYAILVDLFVLWAKNLQRHLSAVFGRDVLLVAWDCIFGWTNICLKC